MRKKIILILALSFISRMAICQDHSAKINIGMSRTNVILNPKDIFSTEDEFKTGFNGELTYKRKISAPFYVGVGIGFIQNGYKFDIYLTDENGASLGTSKTSWNFNYINFPLHIGLELGEKTYFLADFSVIPSVLIKSKMNSESQNYGGDVTEQIDKFDLSGRIGVGIGKHLNENLALDLNLAYQQSLIESEFKNVFAYGGDNEYSHLGVLLTLGMTYSLN